jgi:thiamine-phosphate pyrophosphorylase
VTTLDRIRLARQAAALNASRGCALPPLVLMTDDERLPDPVGAARALPHGSMVIVRARQASHRAKLAIALRPIARARRLSLLIANDANLAGRIGAAGVHFAQGAAWKAFGWRVRRPGWLITVSAHSLRACGTAARLGADAVFLSSVFTTSSHPGRTALGVSRARNIVCNAPLPVYALGGMDRRRACRLAGSQFVGVAAIGALAT